MYQYGLDYDKEGLRSELRGLAEYYRDNNGINGKSMKLETEPLAVTDLRASWCLTFGNRYIIYKLHLAIFAWRYSSFAFRQLPPVFI